MKYVYVVCGKQSKESYNYWVIMVCTSKKAAEKWIEKMNNVDQYGYVYYFREPITSAPIE